MDVKICGKCKESKSLSEFGNNRTKPDKLQSNCKICARLITRNYYHNNKERHLKKVLEISKRNVFIKQEFVANYLIEHPCVDCGESNICCLDFDHVRGNKNANVSIIINNGCSIEKIKNEIEKCEVRCANCHRKRTSQVFNYFRYKFMQNKIIF